jgi:hypothetical protein
MEKNAAFITSKYATSDGMHPVIKKVFCWFNTFWVSGFKMQVDFCGLFQEKKEKNAPYGAGNNVNTLFWYASMCGPFSFAIERYYQFQDSGGYELSCHGP